VIAVVQKRLAHITLLTYGATAVGLVGAVQQEIVVMPAARNTTVSRIVPNATPRGRDGCAYIVAEFIHKLIFTTSN
jgi:hypothetical protein